MIESGYCYPHEKIDSEQKPVFLMGPLRNANDWQREASLYVPKDKGIVLINPRKHPSQSKGQPQDPGDVSQRPWEEEYLNRCLLGKDGAILIWIPERQTPSNGGNPDFGDNTAREVGYLGAKMEANRDLIGRIVFGFEAPIAKNFITDLHFLEEKGLLKGNTFTSLELATRRACAIALGEST